MFTKGSAVCSRDGGVASCVHCSSTIKTLQSSRVAKAEASGSLELEGLKWTSITSNFTCNAFVRRTSGECSTSAAASFSKTRRYDVSDPIT